MPKFKLNEKAVEGRARKAAAAEAKEMKKMAEKEAKINEEWKVGSKDEGKKLEEEAKRLDKIAKKKERERLEAEELAKIPVKVKPPKLELTPASPCPTNRSISSSYKLPLEPLNRPNSVVSLSDNDFNAKTALSEYSASNLDDAISLLEAATGSSENVSLERHPERRVKAAYAAYEEKELPILKLENPSLRLSQLREILKKKWRKAPENPFNQSNISYCTGKNEEKEIASQIFEDTLSNFKK